jgi:hypothetical protein
MVRKVGRKKRSNPLNFHKLCSATTGSQEGWGRGVDFREKSTVRVLGVWLQTLLLILISIS